MKTGSDLITTGADRITTGELYTGADWITTGEPKDRTPNDCEKKRSLACAGDRNSSKQATARRTEGRRMVGLLLCKGLEFRQHGLPFSLRRLRRSSWWHV